MRKYVIYSAVFWGLLLSSQFINSQEDIPGGILDKIRSKSRDCRLNTKDEIIPPHLRPPEQRLPIDSTPIFTPAQDIPEPDGAKNTWWEIYGPEGGNIVGMAIDPKNKNHYFALTSSYSKSSIWESKNAGKKWIYKGSFNDYIYDISIHPKDPDILFLLHRYGIYKTTDGGKNWENSRFQSNNYDCSAYLGQLAINPKNPDFIYASGYYRKSNKNQIAVFLSRNQGKTWSHKILSNATDSAYSFCIEINPVYPGIIYLGGYTLTNSGYKREYKVYKSSDHGNNWNDISGTINSIPEDIAIDPKNHSTVFIATTWGIYYSRNGGSSWTKTNANGYSIAVDSTNSNYIYAGYANSFYRSTDSGESWNYIENYTDSSDPGIDRGTLFGNSNSIISCSKGVYYSSTSGLYFSANKGTSWKPLHSGITANDIPALATAPSSVKKIYAEALNSRFYVSNNFGKSWGGLPYFERCDGIDKIWIHPKNSNEIYFLSGG